jgi:hypothetical protein
LVLTLGAGAAIRRRHWENAETDKPSGAVTSG